MAELNIEEMPAEETPIELTEEEKAMQERLALAKWYVIKVQNGAENKVKDKILKTVENRKFQDRVLSVYVPMDDVIVTKGGVRKIKQEVRFKGYIFVHMINDSDTWYLVRNAEGVSAFVGGKGADLIPLSEEEAADMLSTEVTVSCAYEKGDEVTVVNGAFIGSEGVVEQVNASKETLTISVDLFGRMTPIEIKFNEVKKK